MSLAGVGDVCCFPPAILIPIPQQVKEGNVAAFCQQSVTYMGVDYHVHSRYSHDCECGIEDILEHAERIGLTLIAITDHDTILAGCEFDRFSRSKVGLLLGCEFTSADGSHIIGLGISEMIEEKDNFAIMKGIRAQGGLVVLPHLFRRGSGIFRHELRRKNSFVYQVLRHADAVEIFNGRDSWDHNRESYCFTKRHNLPCVAGSDAHTLEEVGSVFVRYRGEQPLVHGVSPRQVYFPSRTPEPEARLLRCALEFYHRRRNSFPSAIVGLLKKSRNTLKRARRSSQDYDPQLQYDFEGDAR